MIRTFNETLKLPRRIINRFVSHLTDTLFRKHAARSMPWVCIALLGISTATADEPKWSTDIRPLLAQHCADCHGVDEQESGLRLDSGKLTLRGGDRGKAIVPGKPKESLLYQAITHTGEVEAMPAESEKLSATEIKLVERWILAGAKIDKDANVEVKRRASEHWAFQPIRRPQLPQVKNTNWIRTPIDAFVMERLEKLGLGAAPQADRRTLIRRLSFDLLGLPPSLEDVNQFVNDTSPDAYAKLVERLLASPHYGERWGRHWLDLARYADSNGFTIDGERSIWLYRDWVIDAVNRDLRFDQFATQQIAGDMLEKATLSQRIATGFHRNTLINEEGGTNDEEFRVESVVDRVNTTSSIFLGLTVGCAQCHQHKYDPISQREFYQLYAIFNNTADSNDAGDSSGKLGPLVFQATAEQQRKQAAIQQRLDTAKKALATLGQSLEEKLSDWEAGYDVKTVANWSNIDPSRVASRKGATLKSLGDRSYLATGKIPDDDVYEFEFKVPASLEQLTALRLEALTHKSLPKNGPGLTKHGNFTLCEFEVFDADKKVKIAAASADYSQEKGDISQAIDGDAKTFWGIYGPGNVMNKDHEAIFVLQQPIKAGRTVKVLMTQKYETPFYMMGRFRVTASTQSGKVISLPVEIRRILAKPGKDRSKEDRKKLIARMLKENSEYQALKQKADSINSQLTRLRSSIPSTMVLRELEKVRPTHIHVRGDFLRKGAVVKANVPQVLPPISPYGDRVTRLDFAKWLMSPQNPLTTRVTVNRWWQRFFGLGIVETENDFGTQGTLPSHPQLLDWLASELVKREWSVKDMHRLIVMSSTYRQASHNRPELKDDPRNRHLARQRRLRFEAEVIRDAALTSSGLLTRTLKGPSVYPPQPKGIYIITQNKKGWDAQEDKGADRYRRGMYTFFWRSSPYPMLPTFDAPDANTTCTRRSRSNTPLQSLTMANDQAFYEFAVGLAQRVLRSDAVGDAARIKLGFNWSLSRDPNQREKETLLRFVSRQREYYIAQRAEASQLAKGVHDGPAAETATWIAFARVILNLDEFITRE